MFEALSSTIKKLLGLGVNKKDVIAQLIKELLDVYNDIEDEEYDKLPKDIMEVLEAAARIGIEK